MHFASTILSWYAENRRDLPWRNISDPYRIWVSEIILQQTRVVQGYDYYLRFIKAFPTVEALAEAHEDDVLRLWQGLGYYSRARNLHAAARQIVEKGCFPVTYAEVRALKGVGDYTAAAICSFAYHLPCAVVDGNVYRVLSRYFGIDIPIDSTEGKKYFAQLAHELLPAKHAADYNQGLMDFGASQCVPSSPNCLKCPLVSACVAYQQGQVTAYPVKKHKVKITDRYFVYVRVRTPQGYWLRRRSSGDIWQGLYEYPLLEFDYQPSFDEVVDHPFIKSISSNGTGIWKSLVQGLKHVLSHRILHTDAYELEFAESVPVAGGYIEVMPALLSDYAMPQLLLRIGLPTD